MSYQVNFRLLIPNCEYWEAQAVTKLQREIHDACIKAIEENGVKGKQIGLTSGEVTYLIK